MADDDGLEQERRLAERQADGVYPIGRALRSTFRADNHDSLGSDLTGLMLALARVDPPGPPPVPLAPAAGVQPVAGRPAPRGWWARLLGR